MGKKKENGRAEQGGRENREKVGEGGRESGLRKMGEGTGRKDRRREERQARLKGQMGTRNEPRQRVCQSQSSQSQFLFLGYAILSERHGFEMPLL